MPNKKYWQDRFLGLSDRLQSETYKTLSPKIAREIKNAYSTIRKDLSDFYLKYGEIQKSPTFKTLSDGTKVIESMTAKNIVTTAEAYKFKRIFKLGKEFEVAIEKMYEKAESYMTAELITLADFTVKQVAYEVFKGIGYGYSFEIPPEKALMQIIKHPVVGENFSTRITNNTNQLAKEVNRILQSGIAQGKSISDMSDDLLQKFRTSERYTDTLIRTEINNTYNQATLATYEKLDIDTYIYDATLDNKTSRICQELDQRKFNIEDATTGVNYPPMHPNCRSTTVADIGQQYERRARVGKKTFLVPAETTYAEFESKYLKS